MINIAVSACFLYPDLSRTTFGAKTLQYMESDMMRYMMQPDVMPVLIPNSPREERNSILEKMDGLLLQGGSDLAPETYGETPIVEGKWPGDRLRDEYELELIDIFIKAGKPVYGICRGFQIMNAYFGGSLYQDIPTQRPECIKHRDALEYDRLHHGVRFEHGSFFESLYSNEEKPMVNSVHHQAVKELGTGLIAQAFCSEDGITEAFIHRDYEPGKVMGVQWHPEFFHTLGNQLIDPMKTLKPFLSFAEKSSKL